MTAEEFAGLVTRLQQRAEANPRVYSLRVSLLALLGYAAILTALALVVAITVLYPGFLLAAIVVAVIIAASLWVRVATPRGIPLESHQAPRLFRAVERIRESLKFPGFDRVLVVENFNAAITQIPRLGILGWYRNYLLLGMPLLMGLSPEQFQAVLAHEFYHLFGAHSRFDLWLYRIRTTWNRLVENLERRRHGIRILFRWFFDWYVPVLNAHTFVLARQHEYAADRFAADLIGDRAMADALISLKLKEAYLSKMFFPGVWRRAKEQPEPPADIYAQMHQALRRGLEFADAPDWLQCALTAETGIQDSHPALRDRLKALGQPAGLPGPLAESAADHFFGNSLADLCERLATDWQRLVSTRWRQQYDAAEKARQELRALDDKARAGTLEQSEAGQRAYCSKLVHGSDAALPLYVACLEQFPEDAGSHFALGRIQLAKKNSEGIEHIERAMKLDADYVLSGCEQICAYLREAGRAAEAEPYAKRLRMRRELLHAAQEQRTWLRPDDRFYSHDLSTEELERLRTHLARYPAIATAHLVRKILTLLPEKPHYVLGITRRLIFPVWSSQRMITRLAREIPVPRGTMTFVHLGPNRRLRRRITSVPGSRIYKRRWFAGWRAGENRAEREDR